MSLYRVEDTAYVDAFALPSIFDGRAAFYKEWHDFVFYDRKAKLFGLLNFGVHGNPYDSKRGNGSVLAFMVDPQQKILAETDLIQLSELQVSPYGPNYLTENVKVIFDKNEFKIKGRINRIGFDLGLQVGFPPVSTKEFLINVIEKRKKIDAEMILAAQEMNRQWDTWVGIPRLALSGTVNLKDKNFHVDTCRSYHDHEGGRFDWDSTWGWDTGAILCDSKVNGEPKSANFLFYRYGPSIESAYGGIFIETEEGKQRYFDSKDTKISRTDGFSGEQKILPGITRLLYPDYRPITPQKTVFSITHKSDKLTITFVPKAVCSIVVASISGKAEVVFNEMFCNATLEGTVAEKKYDAVIPCWFESVRPRRKR